MRKAITLFCSLLALPLLSVADTLTPHSNRIDAVTVFLDRAEVTRQLEVNLPRGSHSVEISGLPAQLIVESLKVSARGTKGLRIGSVETRREFGEKAAAEEERKLRAQLQALGDQQAQLEGRLQALNTQASFIERLASLPQGRDKENEHRLEPEKWPRAWQAIGTGMAETNAARIKLQHQQRELQQKSRKVKEELRQVETGRRDSLTTLLHIEATNGGKAKFTLGYQLHNATWTPGYDARLSTEQRQLQLIQHAQVRQSSGEAWQNVALTVSTARPSAGAVMPELHPWWIDFSQRVAKRMRMYEADNYAGAPMAEPQVAEEKVKADLIVAATEASEFSVRYRIPGRVSVPADNSPQRFVLAEQQLATTLAVRTTPRRDPRAFLYAELDYPGDTPLLAGEWQLQRDGVYVGKAQQRAIRPGEALALAFGPDDAIQVEHKLVKDERSKAGLLNRDTRIERAYLISVSNGHKQAIPLSVYDQIPVARNEAIVVKLDPKSTKPSEQNVEDRSGVLKWQRTLKPGATVKVDFAYSVSFPQDQQIPGF